MRTTATRVVMTICEVAAGTQAAFEAALAGAQSALTDETLWFRLSRAQCDALRAPAPRASIASIVASRIEPAWPASVTTMIATARVEILTLRPAMSLGLARK